MKVIVYYIWYNLDGRWKVVSGVLVREAKDNFPHSKNIIKTGGFLRQIPNSRVVLRSDRCDLGEHVDLDNEQKWKNYTY